MVEGRCIWTDAMKVWMLFKIASIPILCMETMDSRSAAGVLGEVTEHGMLLLTMMMARGHGHFVIGHWN